VQHAFATRWVLIMCQRMPRARPGCRRVRVETEVRARPSVPQVASTSRCGRTPCSLLHHHTEKVIGFMAEVDLEWVSLPYGVRSGPLDRGEFLDSVSPVSTVQRGVGHPRRQVCVPPLLGVPPCLGHSRAPRDSARDACAGTAGRIGYRVRHLGSCMSATRQCGCPLSRSDHPDFVLSRN
jgi:hypothetical protein